MFKMTSYIQPTQAATDPVKVLYIELVSGAQPKG